MTKLTATPKLRLLVGAGLAALSLQACTKPAATGTTAVTSLPAGAMPLDSSGLPPPPATSTLAPADPAPIAYNQAPRQRYRYVDRAAALNGAFANSPPDYTVDYQGSRPWVWRSRDGSRRVVEHTADGDRSYYYDPGADRPYLVRGPDYTYGYDQGRLAAVYDNQGRALDDAEAAARAERAGEYLYRARQLYYAAEHQQHQAAAAADWQARREAQFADERQWEAQQQRQADWRAWHEQNANQQPVYVQERDSRAAYAASLGAVAVGAYLAGRGSAPTDTGYYPQQAHRPNPGDGPFAGPGGILTPFPGQQARQQQVQVDAARQAQANAFNQQQAAQAQAARLAQAGQFQAAEAARAQANAIAQARQQQAQADAANQAQIASQQRAVAIARAQQGQADAARQSQLAAQQRAVAIARQQQIQADGARQAQARQQETLAAQARATDEARLQAAANTVRQQQAAQAEVVRQARVAQAQAAQSRATTAARQQAEAARAQAAQSAAHQQQQALAQAQAQAARAQAEAAREAQAAAQAKAAHPPAPPAPPKPELSKGPQAGDKGEHRDHHNDHPGDHNAAQP